ncbi:NAD(P)-dependent oxidoreductase [Methylomonas sp. HYX-M1]|uniref:NAD(P)-dependent oxidoreductase n=1 Tax=Methylomonas sp. HYX-M1 TaxID=3139307 RepID=UPI00345BCF63
MMGSKHILGFIGIGLMGQPLVLRLLAAGFDVRVWNRTAEKLATVAQAGAGICDSVAELLRQVDVVLLCLADTAAVEQIAAAELFPHAKPNTLVIDLSSIAPDATRRLAASAGESGMRWVDAPVSGGTAGAEQGSLAIMAGGDAADIAVTRTVLAPLYSRLTHMGPVGSGQITKICNQMIVSCNVMVIAEMMALAKRAGVDSAQIPHALTGGFADSKPLQIVGPEMAAEDFASVKWRVKTLLKDLTLADQIAAEHECSVPMSALAAQLMRLHAGRGYAEQDPATLINLYSNR